MPSSKKPRKAYRARTNKPRLDEASRIFEPIHRTLNALHGEIETVRGYPVFKDWRGEWSRIDHALLGWCDNWDRFGTGINQEPLKKLHRKLTAGVPITEEELIAAQAVADQQQAAFMRLPVEFIKSKTRTELIAIEMDAQKIRRIAA